MITNKRGISPLIATVLIVGFTIILAVIVVNFVLNTTENQTQTQSCQADAQQKCLGFVGSAVQAGVDNSTITNVSVAVTNLGSSDASFIVSPLDDFDATVTGLSPTTIGPISVGGTASASGDFGFEWDDSADEIRRFRITALVDGTSDDGSVSCSATCADSSAFVNA